MSARYVIVIFPARTYGDDIERFRVAWDPLAEEIRGHITLVYPFQTDLSEDQLRATVAEVARSHHPFAVELGDPTVHEGEYLFLLPRIGGEQIEQLHRELYVAIPDAQLRVEFVAHMTIGRNADPRIIERACREASANGFAVRGCADQVSVYRIQPSGARPIEFHASIGSGPASAG